MGMLVGCNGDGETADPSPEDIEHCDSDRRSVAAECEAAMALDSRLPHMVCGSAARDDRMPDATSWWWRRGWAWACAWA